MAAGAGDAAHREGRPAQIADELAAYNPLMPKGSELVATFMIEIDDPDRRQRILGTLGGIEETAFLRVGAETMRACRRRTDRTTAEGKASSVQFVHFPFTPAQIAAFREPGAEVVLGFDHPHYRHMAVSAGRCGRSWPAISTEAGRSGEQRPSVMPSRCSPGPSSKLARRP